MDGQLLPSAAACCDALWPQIVLQPPKHVRDTSERKQKTNRMNGWIVFRAPPPPCREIITQKKNAQKKSPPGYNGATHLPLSIEQPRLAQKRPASISLQAGGAERRPAQHYCPERPRLAGGFHSRSNAFENVPPFPCPGRETRHRFDIAPASLPLSHPSIPYVTTAKLLQLSRPPSNPRL